MPNTLDNILIKYGTSSTKNENDFKITTYKEFLSLKQEELSEREYQIQTAMAALYCLNDCTPPLFLSFPNWRPNKPLTIETTRLSRTHSVAVFNTQHNIIHFDDTDDPELLLMALSHELKHAEQFSQECFKVEKESNLAYHQLNFLSEAQAHAFMTYVAMIACKKQGCTVDEFLYWVDKSLWDFYADTEKPLLEKHYKWLLSNNSKSNAQAIQQDLTLVALSYLSKDSNYKHKYDYFSPIKDNDQDISHIPDSFNLTPAFVKKVMPILKNIQHEALYPANRFNQLLSNGHENLAKAFLQIYPSKAETFINHSFAFLISQNPTKWPLITNQTELDNFESEIYKKFKFLTQYSPKLLKEDEIEIFVTMAMRTGLPRLVHKALNIKKQDSSRVLSDKKIRSLFLYNILFEKKLPNEENMCLSHIALVKSKLNAICEIFLNLKNHNNKPIISKNDIRTVITNNNDVNNVLKNYQKKYPQDPRFHKNISAKMSHAHQNNFSPSSNEQTITTPIKISFHSPSVVFHTQTFTWFGRG
ncbi:MAG: hypothetical protein IKV03_01305 [Alphaproteobacteria bacterium]|nr:hypothetical protein [Alphaproteobacteria bacterium]